MDDTQMTEDTQTADNHDSAKVDHQPSSNKQTKHSRSGNTHKPFSKVLCSVKYVIFILWWSSLHLREAFFILSFNPWITDIVNGDKEKGTYFKSLPNKTKKKPNCSTMYIQTAKFKKKKLMK